MFITLSRKSLIIILSTLIFAAALSCFAFASARTAMNTENGTQTEQDFIKWVDFNVSYEALRDTMEADISSYGTDTHCSWIDMLAYLAAKNGNNFSGYNKKELTTAVGFYKLMQFMGVNIVFNHADYRLMSKRAIEGLAQFPERNMFLRGMVPLIGYRSTSVYYDRNERFAGESKYPLKKMISFAFDGITSFSISPIRMISAFGAIVCVIAVIMAVYALIQKIMGHTDAGWASLMMSIWFIGGVQLLSVGLIGEYIGKLYKEVKRRPRYIIEAYVNERNDI